MAAIAAGRALPVARQTLTPADKAALSACADDGSTLLLLSSNVPAQGGYIAPQSPHLSHKLGGSALIVWERFARLQEHTDWCCTGARRERPWVAPSMSMQISLMSLVRLRLFWVNASASADPLTLPDPDVDAGSSVLSGVSACRRLAVASLSSVQGSAAASAAPMRPWPCHRAGRHPLGNTPHCLKGPAHPKHDTALR